MTDYGIVLEVADPALRVNPAVAQWLADTAKVIEKQLEIERKAQAWDAVSASSVKDPSMALDGADFEAWLDSVWESVHPAQGVTKS